MADDHTVLVLLDFLTLEGELVDYKFVHHDSTLTKLSEKITLPILIQVSEQKIDKVCTMHLD